MSAFYHETHNRASADYPYVQYYSKNLVYRPHFHRDVELAMVVEGQALVICLARWETMPSVGCW